jgi:CheY-like chemotaxis protein
LGLAICKRLVEMMGGRIWVRSRVGEGSAFHVTIRLGSAPAKRGGRRPLASCDLPEESPNGGPRPRVLIAEDNELNQKLAVKMLEKMGYDADVADNGREAVEALARSSYDAILMDCQMPEMDGLEAAQKIREMERERGAHTPIIALTAYAMKGDRERCLAAGMDDYLAKPVKSKDLKAALERWVSRGKDERDPAPAPLEGPALTPVP